jgi:hypothetical protein
MIGTPNTLETGSTTNAAATVTHVTPEKPANLLDTLPENGTLNTGAPGIPGSASAPELLSAGRSEAAGALPYPVTPEPELANASVALELPEQGKVESMFDAAMLDEAMNSRQSLRTHLRYLVVLFPEEPVDRLAVSIWNALDSSGVSAASVVCVLRGRLVNKTTQLSDLRMLIRSKHLNGAAYGGEVDVDSLQVYGRMIMSGSSRAAACRASGIGDSASRRIEKFTGLTKKYEAGIKARAIEAVASGMSIREFAKQEGLPKTTAATRLEEARCLRNQTEEAQCLLRQDQNQ